MATEIIIIMTYSYFHKYMSKRVWLNDSPLDLSYRRLPWRASERASIPCQLARSCQKWTRLGADKGNDLGVAKCYVIGAREVPRWSSELLCLWEPYFSSRQWSRGRERNTTWAQEQTPSNLFTSARPYGRNRTELVAQIRSALCTEQK